MEKSLLKNYIKIFNLKVMPGKYLSAGKKNNPGKELCKSFFSA